MNPGSGTPDRQAGISLIDTLVALVILALSIVSISMLTSTTLENNRLSRRLVGGLHLGQAKLEELRGLGYAGVISGSDGPLTSDGAAAGTLAIYTRSWSVADDIPAAGIKRVDVNVSWPDKRGEGSVMVTTLVIEP